MKRRVVYAVLAVWTVAVAGVSAYLLPSGLDASIGVVKVALGVWVAGVAVLGGVLFWRDPEFFPD